jgi:hypothetical protein
LLKERVKGKRKKEVVKGNKEKKKSQNERGPS